MLNQFNYTITRDEAKEKTIASVLDSRSSEGIEKMFSDFNKGWNAIQIDKQFDRNTTLSYEPIGRNSSIAFASNENGTAGFGMHLHCLYIYFIKYQNNFLNTVVTTYNPHCSYFQESVSQKIQVQDATKTEVVSFDINRTNSQFDSFEELINCFSKKECFDSKWNINYSAFSSFSINYRQIEEALGVALLPGKRLFDTGQSFMNSGFEASPGDKSSVITNYLTKYPQEELMKGQKESLSQFCNANRGSILSMLFSIPQLIFYIEKNNYQRGDLITYIVSNLAPFMNLKCKPFFMFHNSLKVSHLIKVFEYFEHLCFPVICSHQGSTIPQDDLPESTKRSINDYLTSMREGSLLNRLNLATATRKFISRKLSGRRAQNDVSGDQSIFLYIFNEDYWPESF